MMKSWAWDENARSQLTESHARAGMSCGENRTRPRHLRLKGSPHYRVRSRESRNNVLRLSVSDCSYLADRRSVAPTKMGKGAG
jgi:hypothetical protein